MERQQGVSLVLARTQGRGRVPSQQKMEEQSPGCFFFIIIIYNYRIHLGMEI